MRIAMWSGPRNLSTAMMYAFAARPDCAVIDEPFYAAFLAASQEVHPMQEAIMASQPSDPQAVIDTCIGPVPQDKPVFYQKQMAHHMMADFPLGWLEQLTNVFLLRHPARVLASYDEKRQNPSLEDIGVTQQTRLFERVRALHGKAPVVIDSDDILAAPERGLRALCQAIGLPFDASMLSWPAGGNAADGVWAPHWYNRVWASTGLAATQPKPLPELPPALARVCQQALPHYEALAQHKLAF
ncbi:HAD family hydrolase [Alteromonas aestuariivivens]|uniref:HAD family hydrolase n=1 Tax=Alteromonas aestuariivivens TaxID=1938339 RepID=A0A3D8MA07_9ALTE|nr:HAD family hydrolase [Alteromonas aestuariivivens]RDV26816.1 HAD family hydrolase [Alteromonas aestuariivivens]